MNESEQINELADAVALLAGSVETLASRQCDFEATNDAQVARETVQRLRANAILLTN